MAEHHPCVVMDSVLVLTGTVNCLPSSRCSAVCWIQYENNAGNMPMLYFFLSSAYFKSRTIQFPMFCQRGATQEVGGAWPVELIQNGQRDIPCHRTSCQVYKLVELPGRIQSLLRDRLGINQPNGEKLYFASLVFLGFFVVSLFIVLLCHYIFLYFTFIQIRKPFLSQPMVLPFFPLILLPIPPGEV